MFVRLGHLFLIIALLGATGGHWAVLQTIAWAGMLASNLKTESVNTAITNTFDGEHPCRMCKAIESGRKDNREQAPEKITTESKLKGVLPAATALFYAPACTELHPPRSAIFPSFQPEPQTPPPRGAGAV